MGVSNGGGGSPICTCPSFFVLVLLFFLFVLLGLSRFFRDLHYPVLPFLYFSVYQGKTLKVTKDFCPPPNPLKPWKCSQSKHTFFQQEDSLLKINKGKPPPKKQGKDGQGIFSGIFPSRPLSRHIDFAKSTYEEQSQKSPRHNPDLSRKKWETPRFGNSPVHLLPSYGSQGSHLGFLVNPIVLLRQPSQTRNVKRNNDLLEKEREEKQATSFPKKQEQVTLNSPMNNRAAVFVLPFSLLFDRPYGPNISMTLYHVSFVV